MRSRLEDQRGTEINFELPDFLKDKENDQRNNARKMRRGGDGAITENARFYMTEGVLHPKPERVTPPISSAKNLKLELQSNYENRTIMPVPNNVNNNNTSINRNNNFALNNQSSQSTVNNLRIYSPNKFSSDESSKSSQNSPVKSSLDSTLVDSQNNTLTEDGSARMEPPPLPPKPKILPIRPSNWGQNLRTKPALYLEQPTSSFV